MDKNEDVKILRPTDFTPEAYRERRKKYYNNLKKYLEEKEIKQEEEVKPKESTK